MHNDSTTTNNAISTLFVSYLMKKFGFDTLYYGLLHGLVLNGLTILFAYNFSWFNDIYSYLFYLPFLPIIGIVIYYSITYYHNYTNKDYITINICHESYIKNVISYIRLNPTYYDIFTNTNIGDLDKKSELLFSIIQFFQQ